METLDNNMGSMSNELELRTREYLTSAGKWAKFLAILGFIGCGLILIGSMFALSLLRSANMSWLILLYIAVAILYFIPSLYLYRFSAAAIETGYSGSSSDLEVAMMNLKKFLKFVGIFVIIILSIYALVFIGALLFAGAMRL